MRPALAAALACALSGCWLFSSDFRLSGTVHVAPGLRERATREGLVLFVVAKNAGGVPIAMKRVVDPEFPAAFKMNLDDLLVPSVGRREPLNVHAEMNPRGDVGAPRAGDLTGAARQTAFPGDGDVRLVLDRVEP